MAVVSAKPKVKVVSAPARPWSGALARAGWLLLLLVGVVYARSLTGQFLWDDDENIVKSVPLRTLSGLGRIWFEPGAMQQYYPLTHSSFWLDYQLWGLHPFAYHLENVLLHALSALLLWMGLKRLRVKGAWLGAALFALHPVQVESVAWITERKNTLSGVFFMASILAAIPFWRLDQSPEKAAPTEGPRPFWEGLGGWKFYWLSVGLFLLGMWSKTAIIGLPAVLLVLVWWKRGRFGLRDLVLLIPYALIAAGLAVFTMAIEDRRGAVGEIGMFSWLERGLLAARALTFYLGKLLWPHPLMFMYPKWTLQASQGLAYVPAVGWLAAVGYFWTKRRSWGRPLLAGLGVFALMLFPVLGFFGVVFFYYSFVCDHFQYLAMIGPCALAGAGLAWAGEAWRPFRRVYKPLAAALVALLAGLTFMQIGVYRDLDSLWQDTLAHNPDSWMAHDNLGTRLSNQNRFEEAAGHYREAIRLHPTDSMAYNNLGFNAARQGRLEEAIENYTRALQLRPAYPLAEYNLGTALARLGKSEEAVEHLTRALHYQPDFAAALYSRGMALSQQAKTEQAIADLTQTLRLQPEFTLAHLGLARIATAQGRVDQAIEYYQQALAVDPGLVEALANLGNIWTRQNKLDDAVECYRRALQVEPGSPVLHYNLGVAYSRLGRSVEAQMELARAQQLNMALPVRPAP